MQRKNLTLYLAFSIFVFYEAAVFCQAESYEPVLIPKAWPCPDNFEPCICFADNTTYDIYADCSAATTDESLTAAFSGPLSIENFRELKINQTGCDSTCNLNTLSSETFGQATFEHVDIRGTTIEVVEDGAFTKSHQHLISLVLPSNKIWSFPFEAIGEYAKLTTLNLGSNSFRPETEVQPITSSSLLTLVFSNNPGLHIGPELVINCPLIETVNLRGIELDVIPENLEEPIGMFTGLANLRNVYFDNNNIRVLRTDIIVGQFNTLKHVGFTNNQINVTEHEFVKGFSDSSNSLDLSFNQIQILDESIWRPIFENVNTGGGIALDGNPLLCGCEIAWLVYDRAMMNITTSTTTCADGVTQIHDLPVDFFLANC